MAMKQGVPYRMVNTVIEFEDGRRIAWAPKPAVFGRELNLGGRVWRYELEPVDGGTRVRETWDATNEKGFALEKLMGAPKQVGKSLDATLERIATIVEAPPPSA
jgi:hypothetical protein